MDRTLTITRKSSLVAALVKYDVRINGSTVAKIGNGETITLPIPTEPSKLEIAPRFQLKPIIEITPGGQENVRAELSIGVRLTSYYLRIEFSSDEAPDNTEEKRKLNLFDTIQNSYQAKKAADEAERDFVRNHKGTQAICAYMKTLFEKGNPGYNWLKANPSFPLYPKIEGGQVLLCYSYTQKNPQSFKEAMPRDEEVTRYNFQEMYRWYGLADGEGYNLLDTKLKEKELVLRISSAVQELPHIRYNGGFVVKMFQ